ncbi:hypothetical protein BYT27DRAFT_7243878 [Phlegmacium glaucopus]|nr:hypothetical protein BYT27DRAFT_7243878 [Phlegmacium glaucopus]
MSKNSVKSPSDISCGEVSTLPVALTTLMSVCTIKILMIFGLVPPPIVILGGFESNSVGQNNIDSIQLVKLSGFSPIITTASLKHAEFLKSLGATHVIDRNVSASSVATEVSSITKDAPIKYAVDSISLADTQQAAYLLG